MNEDETWQASVIRMTLGEKYESYKEALVLRATYVQTWRAAGHTQRAVAEALGVTPAVIAKIDRQNERNDNG